MLLFHEVCHSAKIYSLIDGLKLENEILKEVGSNESDERESGTVPVPSRQWRRPRSRSSKPETKPEKYDKFASSRKNKSAKSRSLPRKPESLQLQGAKETKKTTQTATSDDKDTNDLPASPQLSIDFSNNPFSSTFYN